jgi:putative FmdB family regulatory protein
MPIYEFVCNACKTRTSVFVRTVFSEVNAKCERCGGSDLRRLISKVLVKKSDGFGGSFDDLSGLDENDPRAMAAFARQMQAETGEGMDAEFEDMVSRMERGESIGDLGGDDDDFGL